MAAGTPPRAIPAARHGEGTAPAPGRPRRRRSRSPKLSGVPGCSERINFFPRLSLPSPKTEGRRSCAVARALWSPDFILRWDQLIISHRNANCAVRERHAHESYLHAHDVQPTLKPRLRTGGAGICPTRPFPCLGSRNRGRGMAVDFGGNLVQPVCVRGE
jgi:hypothetical protein